MKRRPRPPQRLTRTPPTRTPGAVAAAPLVEAELEALLRAGLQTLGADAPQDPALPGRLVCYLGLLARWGQAINLTAVRDPPAMVTHHLLDCLAAGCAVRRELDRPGHLRSPTSTPDRSGSALARGVPGEVPGGSLRVLDVGSGAGLPGVVWALAEPGWRLTCVDTVAKKVGFIRQAAAELGLSNLQAEHARVEAWAGAEGGRGGAFDLITSRAFSSLADFLTRTRHLGHEATCWVAMKGQTPHEELAALPSDFEMFHVEPLEVPGLHAHRCLVWMRRRPLAASLALASGAAVPAKAVDKP